VSDNHHRFGISGVQVTRILDSIALFRGYPATIRTDQGPEFTCRALDQWAFEHGGVTLNPAGKANAERIY
jgi:transposase InsO family protein